MTAQTPPGENYEVVKLGDPFWVPIGPLYIDKARQRLCMYVSQAACNYTGALHGGALSTLADAQLIALGEHRADPETHTPTVNLTVDFIGMAKEGEWLEAEVTLLRATRRLLFTQAIITVGDRIIGRSNAIYRNNPKSRYELT